MNRRADHRRSQLIAMIGGAAAGGIAGLVVAVNLVIYLGPDQGYESTIGEVFDHSTVLGFVAVAVVAAGPMAGIAIVRRSRRRQGEAIPPADR